MSMLLLGLLPRRATRTSTQRRSARRAAARKGRRASPTKWRRRRKTGEWRRSRILCWEGESWSTTTRKRREGKVCGH